MNNLFHKYKNLYPVFFKDSELTIFREDPKKTARFDLSLIGTNRNRLFQFPNKDGVLALMGDVGESIGSHESTYDHELIGTAIQPGDNISDLNNDAQYIDGTQVPSFESDPIFNSWLSTTPPPRKLVDQEDVDGLPTSGGQFPIWNDTTNYFEFHKSILDYYTKTEIDDIIREVIYTPYSVNVINGTYVSGNVDSVSSLDINDLYIINEVTGTPGYNIRFNYSDIIYINRIWLHVRYEGVISHTVNVDLYNYNTATWDTFTAFSISTEFQFLDVPIPNSSDYVSSGNAQLRIYHVSSGHPSHKISIDYAVLVQAGMGSSNEHGALLGLLHDDHPQYLLRTEANISNWDTAYGWGNHALAGYALATSLGNYVPYTGATTNVALGAHNITAANLAISNWNTAHGWGDHSLIGYYKASNFIAGTNYEVPLTFSTGLSRVGNTITSTITQYTHPTGFTSQPSSVLTGANVISQVTVNSEGHVTGVTSRVLTLADLSYTAYILPLAASGTRGGLQIGYTATGANIPLLLSSEKGYVTLTNASIVAGLGYTPYNATNPNGYTTNIGTVTSVAASSGTGISITGSPITTSGTLTITNTAPHIGTDLSFTGTVSPFTLNSSTGTDVTFTAGSGIGLAATSGNITITNSSPDQIVVLTPSTGISISGTYPSFTIANSAPHIATNIAQGTRTTTTVPVTSSTGTGATLTAATTSLAGVMTSADKTKLDGIAAGATNYSHPSGFSNQPASALTGANVISQVTVNTEGHVTGVQSRGLTLGDLSFTYPGAGIPLSTGSGWGASITDNSANWNTAFGWGDFRQFGLGRINSILSPGNNAALGTIPSGLWSVNTSTTGTAEPFTSGALISIRSGVASNENTSVAQMYFRANNTLQPRAWIRHSSNAGVFANWVELYHTGNFIAGTHYQAPITNPVTGTGTTNYISKWTGLTTQGNSQIFDNGTNVGIGTTTPSTKLDVDGNARFRAIGTTASTTLLGVTSDGTLTTNVTVTGLELSADPANPTEGSYVTWMSNGTGSGDDGDIMMKITAGGVTKIITLVDFSTH